MPPKKTKRQEEPEELKEVEKDKTLKKGKKGSKKIQEELVALTKEEEKKPRSSSRKKKESETKEEVTKEVKGSKRGKKKETDDKEETKEVKESKRGKKKESKDNKVQEEDEEEEEEGQVENKTAKGKGRVEIARQLTMDDYVAVPVNFVTGDGKFDKEKIMISSWNVNGLRAVLSRNDIQNYVKQTNPDIICLSETKVDNDQVHSVSTWIPPEYTSYFNCCKTTKGYAGTAILTKVKPISVKFDLGIKKHDLEGRTITLEFEHFYLITCYVPNAGQRLERLDYRTKEWDLDFRNYLNSLKAKKHVILCGDLNVAHQEIDIHKPKGNEKSAGFTKAERQGFTDLLSTGWIDTYRHLYPTQQKFSYWSARFNNRETNKGWRLDYFVIDQEGIGGVVDSIINNDIKGSDHCPIELIYKPNFV